MIPEAHLTHWRATSAPWPTDEQVEQDLVISRALVDIFSDEFLREALAFRGGTALYKLHLAPARYSEDIDLVQVRQEGIGETADRLKAALDPWLGSASYDSKHGRYTLKYKFDSEAGVPLRLKVEINTREHFALGEHQVIPFDVDSRWFSGATEIRTFGLHELLATKLRALYQRKKGRDLYDLWKAGQEEELDYETIVDQFHEYMTRGETPIRRFEFDDNLQSKRTDRSFTTDIGPLLADPGEFDFDSAFEFVVENYISRLAEE
jgi:predicted nucleotidyltransferase component of viral defense system